MEQYKIIVIIFPWCLVAIIRGDWKRMIGYSSFIGALSRGGGGMVTFRHMVYFFWQQFYFMILGGNHIKFLSEMEGASENNECLAIHHGC